MKFLTTFVGRVFPLSGRRVHPKEQEYAGQKSVDRMETGRMEERNSQKSDTGFRILDVGCQNVGRLNMRERRERKLSGLTLSNQDLLLHVLCGLARRVSGGSVAIFSEAFSFAEEGSDLLVLIRIEGLGS